MLNVLAYSYLIRIYSVLYRFAQHPHFTVHTIPISNISAYSEAQNAKMCSVSLIKKIYLVAKYNTTPIVRLTFRSMKTGTFRLLLRVTPRNLGSHFVPTSKLCIVKDYIFSNYFGFAELTCCSIFP